jgi:hypothetical protein
MPILQQIAASAHARASGGVALRVTLYLSCVFCFIAGCAEADGPQHRFSSEHHTTLTQPFSPIPDGAGLSTRITGDASRIDLDIRRAIMRCEWGLEHIDITPQGKIASDGRVSVLATALLPNDRHATVQALANNGSVDIRVLVGHFGDAALQARFMDELRQSMREPPTPRRDAGFTLPQ